MSKDFESGIINYVKAEAKVTVFFPVDKNGVAYICCSQCPFYRYQSKKCELSSGICELNPDKYVSSSCPLERSED